ncbi:hypothetical protein K431DRAFT_321639 [Polychaeton citri CBS 116435]|uniref:Uncharacterized protein n=1 Tax=Polychaeton citri CBS 116435 TaxID=1314669 RepID=A0A9P4Q2Z2_9PEZI|nr:hypothetical protein K431DRAFT_321639 [Polychaeton citri CBS 116435]
MAIAIQASIQENLSGFEQAAQQAAESLPQSDSLSPPESGISLLDTKNEIFLSYLQALALRNLNVIRSLSSGSDVEETRKLSNALTKKLCEHRVYLERGVRPLEQRIKYQVDKVLKAADDEERAVQFQKNATLTNGKRIADDSGSGSEDSEDDDDEAAEDDNDIDELAFRPNPAAFARPQEAADDVELSRKDKMKQDGVYRPPRISATAMPTTETRERKEKKPMRSAAIDDYVNNELSTAPTAQPSIGSTIDAGGRRTKTARQLAAESERREYEETNLVRLPKESKKDRAKKGGRGRDGYGGDEWKGIGDSVDRISALTRRKDKDGALDKSRKRTFVEDGPRGSGDAGGAFEMKKRRLENRHRR